MGDRGNIVATPDVLRTCCDGSVVWSWERIGIEKRERIGIEKQEYSVGAHRNIYTSRYSLAVLFDSGISFLGPVASDSVERMLNPSPPAARVSISVHCSGGLWTRPETKAREIERVSALRMVFKRIVIFWEVEGEGT